MESWPCIVIAGPTATGKTVLAAGLAHALGSEVFSVDSRQVYRGLDLGTGKDLAEYRRFQPPVPTHLIDIAEPEETYSLFRYQEDCHAALEEFRSRRGTMVPPVLCGGTGLYLEALLKGYELPPMSRDSGLRRELEEKNIEELRTELRDLDAKAYARIDLANKRRVIRAVEIAKYAPSSPEINLRAGREWSLQPLIFVTTWDRAALRARIAARLDARLSAGLVEEVRYLRARDVSWERLEMLGMEYRQVAAYLQGKKDYESMKADLRHDIHFLAKRQETWFRGMERRGLKTVPIGPEITSAHLRERYEAWRRGGLAHPE